MQSLVRRLDSKAISKAALAVFDAMDEIKANDEGWASYFHSQLSHKRDGVVLHAGFALKDQDRQAAIKALRGVAKKGGLLGGIAKESLRHQFGVVLAPS